MTLRSFLCFALASLVPDASKADDTSAITGFVDDMMNGYESDAHASIKELCMQKWSKDYVMIEYCIQEQTEARSQAQQFDAMASKENTIIWGECVSKWSDDSDRVDWVMADYCISEQSQALERLKSN